MYYIIDMEILAIIPARGGSKSIPRKNLKLLAGKPLMAWTIEESKKSKYLTRIIVSTDDREIAEVAKKYGAEAPFLRPVEIAQDLSTDVEFLSHALNWLKDNENYEPEIILRLPPTSPLRKAEHIDEGIKALLADPKADAVRPITESPKHPYKMWVLNDSGKYLKPFLPGSFTGLEEPHNLPRQPFPKVYIHTGAMDVMRLHTIRDLKSTSGKNLGYFFMPPEDSVNIDSLVDFEMAEFFMQKRLKQEKPKDSFNT